MTSEGRCVVARSQDLRDASLLESRLNFLGFIATTTSPADEVAGGPPIPDEVLGNSYWRRYRDESRGVGGGGSSDGAVDEDSDSISRSAANDSDSHGSRRRGRDDISREAMDSGTLEALEDIRSELGESAYRRSRRAFMKANKKPKCRKTTRDSLPRLTFRGVVSCTTTVITASDVTTSSFESISIGEAGVGQGGLTLVMPDDTSSKPSDDGSQLLDDGGLLLPEEKCKCLVCYDDFSLGECVCYTVYRYTYLHIHAYMHTYELTYIDYFGLQRFPMPSHQPLYFHNHHALL